MKQSINIIIITLVANILTIVGCHANEKYYINPIPMDSWTLDKDEPSLSATLQSFIYRDSPKIANVYIGSDMNITSCIFNMHLGATSNHNITARLALNPSTTNITIASTVFNVTSSAYTEFEDTVFPSFTHIPSGSQLALEISTDQSSGLAAIRFSNGTIPFVELATDITYTLTYLAGNNGTILGTSPQTVVQGSNGTQVTAKPDANYEFVNWSDGLTVNPRIDISVARDITVKANFIEKKQPTSPWSLFLPAILSSTEDCNGVKRGSAYVDNCGNCVGGTTGITACQQDCSGEWGGPAEVDECGMCGGTGAPCPECTLTCNSSGFDKYSCGSSSVYTEYDICRDLLGRLVNYAYKWDFKNGHIVTCTAPSACTGEPVTCSDNTGQACTTN